MNKEHKRQWLVHAVAACADCNFNEMNYTIAIRVGRNHSKKTGHTVTIETGYVQIYNP